MPDEIVNRVANSQLITIDLEDYYPKGTRTIIDIKTWLHGGLILKEKDFRSQLKRHDWSQYKNHYVGLICTTDVILPSWTFMLIATYIAPLSKKVIIGGLKELEAAIFQDILNKINLDPFNGRSIVVKGCSKLPIPETAYLHIIEKLQPIVKTIMFGEACSAVPLYKRKC